MMNDQNRREFIRSCTELSLGAVGLSLMPASVLAGTGQDFEEDPHFLLQMVFPGGVDWSYFWDARPLEMTAKGLIQNYTGKEPIEWKARNASTLASPIVEPLLGLKDYFTIIKGVHMSRAFDGHDQNMNVYFAGNAFGGESFIPHLNTGDAKTKIDAVNLGDRFFAQLTNSQSTLALQPESAKLLVNEVTNSKDLDPESEVFQFIQRTYERNMKSGKGLFSRGVGRLKTALVDIPELSERIKSMKIEKKENDYDSMLVLMREIYRTGIARSIVISKDHRIDTHSAEQQKEFPKKAKAIVEEISKVIEFLRSTPYDETRSLYDLTTFLVTSEFNRTMRQRRRAIDDTGTDHNGHSNIVLVGGKGFKSGYLIGESDFQKSDEVLSKAHLSVDPRKVRLVGRPFDHRAMKSKKTLPEKYLTQDYLQCGSVINTVYKAFGFKPNRKYPRSEKLYPILDGLLS